MKKYAFITLFLFNFINSNAQKLAPTPPMGFMSWNYFADKVNEKDLKEVADAMVNNGMVAAGYQYIFIDDCWQGGRDSQNNIIPDPKKFPSGMKALADYLHSRGMKLGIYSDADQLTCAGYTASLNFEEQDAHTFAAWGVDYLKYDYCGAPSDVETAQARYGKMADALRHSGRDIVFGACEWGQRQPWLWAAKAGAQLWRASGDIRDKWIAIVPANKSVDDAGWGIIDVVNRDAELAPYAGPGHWNDPDMLVVGLYGMKGPSGDLGGVGCNDTEYQSQMSLWCLMAAPLMASCDVRNMNEATKSILLNKDILAIDQDKLGSQAVRKINNRDWNVFVKPLANGDYAVGILNLSGKSQKLKISLDSLGLKGKFDAFDVWSKKRSKGLKVLNFNVSSHETKVIRLNK